MTAFGSYGSTQQSPTVYGYAFFNKEASIDKTMMSFSMWKTSLKVGIYPLIETDDDQVKYDRKNGVAAFLIPQKAFMLAMIMREFKKDPVGNDNRGIASGQSLISICSGTFFGKPDAGPALVIRKISKEGQVEASYAYEFRQNFYTSIDGFDEKNGKFDQSFESFNNIEIDTAILQLEEYYKAMSNATAFTVAEALYPNLEKIANKLGVDLLSNYNGGGYKNNSYFNNHSNGDNGSTQSSTPQYNSTNLESLISG
jgi:hypothetical protein